MALHPRELTQIQAHLTKTLKPNLLNSLLKSLTLSQSPEKVIQIHHKTLHVSDNYTFTYVLKACSLLHATHVGHQLHARIIKSGHHQDIFVQNSLINFYSTSSHAASARRIFTEILSPDVISWTTLISALARSGCAEEALEAFSSMDVKPNAMTLVSVLAAVSKPRDLKMGKAIHGFCLRSIGECRSNLILGNAVLDMYMRCGDLVAARKLFGEMAERDVVSWTTMISGYARNGGSEEAIRVFRVMLEEGEVAPNEATLVSVLRSCASMGALSLGKCVHSYACRSHGGVDGFMGNALINMYAKCGDIHMALRMFDLLPWKDLVSWCSIIGGMAVNGLAKQSLQLFSLMLCHGVEPDAAAFLALLSACCHAGLVDQALMIFKAMSEVYRINPHKEHYTCMLDAYGRAGRLAEAEDFVLSMPIEPDGHVWGALLNAFRIHGSGGGKNQSLKHRILQGVVGAEGGTYALLSNMLADSGKWEDSNFVREQMRIRRIRKAAGCTWIGAA